MLVYGVIVTAVLLTQFSMAATAVAAGSIAFVGLVTYELVRLIVLRTNYNIPWFSNPWLSVALVSSFATLIPVLYFNSVSELFRVQPPSANEALFIAGASILIFIFMKLTRQVLNRVITEANPQFTPDHYDRAG